MGDLNENKGLKILEISNNMEEHNDKTRDALLLELSIKNDEVIQLHQKLE